MDRRILGLILCLLLSACSKPAAPADAKPETPVQVADAERAAIHRTVTGEGVLHPINQSAIVPKISAPIRTFHAMKGDRVRKGQVVAELENRDLQAAVAEAKSNYEQMQSALRTTTNATVPEDLKKAQLDVDTARQALEAAQRVYESRQELLRQGAIPRRSVDEANLAYVQTRNQLEAATRHLQAIQNVGHREQILGGQAQVDAAKAKYDAAVAQLAYTRIESPIDGVVTDRPLYPGEMAAVDKPVITVMDVSSVIARANVPNEQLKFLKVGQPGTITAQDGASELSGRVIVVSPALDPNSTTGEVWIQAANPGAQFHPGANVRVSVVTETVKDAVIVPTAALLPSDEGGAVIFVVGKNSVAHARKVEIGIREPEKVQILKGVEPGEKVVVVGGLGLEDGAKVKVEEAAKEDEKKAGDKKDEKK